MKAFCADCRHYEQEEEEHLCYAEAEEQIDYVSGEKFWANVVYCDDKNFDGECPDFKRR